MFLKKNYKRIIFNSITKSAILEAINKKGDINKQLVDAQKARRILDRLYGYMISPILSKQLGGSLSAGRVQSVATKIIIDKENEIKKFIEENKDSCFFCVYGNFENIKFILFQSSEKYPHKNNNTYKGKTAKIPIDTDDENINIKNFMKLCLKSKFIVHSVEDKMSKRGPSPPFTTSTLQQEAARKLYMSIDKTMKTAQKII